MPQVFRSGGLEGGCSNLAFGTSAVEKSTIIIHEEESNKMRRWPVIYVVLVQSLGGVTQCTLDRKPDNWGAKLGNSLEFLI